MKKLLMVGILIFSFNYSYSQVELKGTMGINFLSIPSVQDYINQSYPLGEEIGTFSTAVIFAGEGGYFISNNFVMSVEIPYQIYSYNSNIGSGQYELIYNSLLTSVLAYYVLKGDGYNFKFGGGVGPRFVRVSETKKWQGTETDFSSTGFGVVLRAEGNTILGSNLYANIGFDMRYDVNGEPEDSGGNKLSYRSNSQNEIVNFNSFAVGVRLGVSYLIGGSD
jgi:hypothetical protein